MLLDEGTGFGPPEKIARLRGVLLAPGTDDGSPQETLPSGSRRISRNIGCGRAVNRQALLAWWWSAKATASNMFWKYRSFHRRFWRT